MRIPTLSIDDLGTGSAHAAFILQMRTSYIAGSFVIVTAILLWFVKSDTCSRSGCAPRSVAEDVLPSALTFVVSPCSYIFTWLGLLPCQARVILHLGLFMLPNYPGLLQST